MRNYTDFDEILIDGEITQIADIILVDDIEDEDDYRRYRDMWRNFSYMRDVMIDGLVYGIYIDYRAGVLYGFTDEVISEVEC